MRLACNEEFILPLDWILPFHLSKRVYTTGA